MKKVLLVDDESNILLAVTMCLEGEGYEVITAVDGVEAVGLAFDSEPDIVLLDVRIPKLNGFLVCKALKEDARTKEIPIIFLSARAEEEDIRKGLSLGAVDYLVKPIEPDDLIDRVKNYLTK